MLEGHSVRHEAFARYCERRGILTGRKMVSIRSRAVVEVVKSLLT